MHPINMTGLPDEMVAFAAVESCSFPGGPRDGNGIRVFSRASGINIASSASSKEIRRFIRPSLGWKGRISARAVKPSRRSGRPSRQRAIKEALHVGVIEAHLMTSQRRFRILTPERGLSSDTFVLPAKQPSEIKPGCTAVVHERSGTLLVVRDTRLFPAEAAGTLPVADAPKSDGLKYDRARGVIEVRLNCPDRGGNLRGMVRANETPLAARMPTLAPLMDYRRNLVT
jgi:hypothetical protein